MGERVIVLGVVQRFILNLKEKIDHRLQKYQSKASSVGKTHEY